MHYVTREHDVSCSLHEDCLLFSCSQETPLYLLRVVNGSLRPATHISRRRSNLLKPCGVSLSPAHATRYPIFCQRDPAGYIVVLSALVARGRWRSHTKYATNYSGWHLAIPQALQKKSSMCHAWHRASDAELHHHIVRKHSQTEKLGRESSLLFCVNEKRSMRKVR